MEADLYSFDFDPRQVAQHPPERRGESRLLQLRRGSGERSHHAFEELPDLVRGDELLVVNETKVLPARLLGQRASGGKVEALLVAPAPEDPCCWQALARSNKPLKVGQRLHFADEEAEILGRNAEGLVTLRWRAGLDLGAFLEQHGRVPLPPYIQRAPDPEDEERYQTVFATQPGAVAAPTAGLHFGAELLERLRERGLGIARVTLHVGPGTFRPIASDRLDDHRMHSEHYEVPEETAATLREARRAGRPILAVGTTVVRTLEAAALAAEAAQRAEELLLSGPGDTDLFLRPGYRFRVVDQLVTNFHWPRSTLLVLVSALAGREPILAAYRDAVERGYRLFSYGDAMWIR